MTHYRLTTQDQSVHEHAELLNYVNGGGKFRLDGRIVYAGFTSRDEHGNVIPTEAIEGGVDTASQVSPEERNRRSIW